MNPAKHNASTYSNHRCRCEECRAAWRAYVQRRRAERRVLLLAGLVSPAHGNESTYNNYHCRCGECRLAHNATRVRQHAAKS